MESWLEINNIEMYSTQNEGKSVTTLENKTYKYITSISKKVYIDKLDDIVNYENPKFKIGDNVRISKYKDIFAKGYTPNWSEEVFVITKIKNNVPWTCVINNLNGEEIVGTFYENELPKKKKVEKNLEQKKKKKERVTNYMLNGKVMTIHLIIGQIKKT